MIVRRLLPHRMALAAAMITALLSAALLAALASFSATVTSNAVRTSLASNPATGISITGSVTSAAVAARADARVRKALRRALPVAPLAIVSSQRSDYLDIPADLGGQDAETHVISVPDLPGHAVLLPEVQDAAGQADQHGVVSRDDRGDALVVHDAARPAGTFMISQPGGRLGGRISGGRQSADGFGTCVTPVSADP